MYYFQITTVEILAIFLLAFWFTCWKLFIQLKSLNSFLLRNVFSYFVNSLWRDKFSGWEMYKNQVIFFSVAKFCYKTFIFKTRACNSSNIVTSTFTLKQTSNHVLAFLDHLIRSKLTSLCNTKLSSIYELASMCAFPFGADCEKSIEALHVLEEW